MELEENKWYEVSFKFKVGDINSPKIIKLVKAINTLLSPSPRTKVFDLDYVTIYTDRDTSPPVVDNEGEDDEENTLKTCR